MKQNNHFYGKYYKFISDDNFVLACIISHANEGDMLQVITPEGSFFIEDTTSVSVTDNVVSFNVQIPKLSVKGELTLGELHPLKKKVMEIFEYLPLESKHDIYSMFHTINGELEINGEKHTFSDSLGYIEGDKGTNFPQKYIWYNSVTKGYTATMAIATIPMFGFIRFLGILCFIKTPTEEYYLCTYNGAKVEHIKSGEIAIKKGKFKFELTFDDPIGFELKAPVKGDMKRYIKECVTIPTHLKFTEGGKVLIDNTDEISSLEFMWD